MNNGLKSVFGKEADWEKVINSIDTNNDGLVDYDEFMTAASNRVKLLNDQNLRNAFDVLDSGGDGYISADELQGAFMRGNIKYDLPSQGILFNEKYWKKLLDEMDTDKDGQISFEEFKTYMLDLNTKGNMLRTSYS